jgi:hypothetical protein
MMISTLFRTVSLTFALGLAQSAGAATVFNNGGPDYFYGTGMSASVVADNFTLSGETNLTNIRFWSTQSVASDYLGSITWSIYDNDVPNDLPGILRFSGVAAPTALDTGQVSSFSPSYGVYAFNVQLLVPLNLSAGNYWLGLNNSPLDGVNPREMLWATTGQGLPGEGVYLDAGSWVGTGNEHAFLLEGTAVTSPIPEPYMPAMMLAGLATLAGLRRFKRLDKSSPSSP